MNHAVFQEDSSRKAEKANMFGLIKAMGPTP